MELYVNTAHEMNHLGRRWSRHIRPGTCVYFEGDLGAGKTTLIQGVIAGLGVSGPVLSPTFSIVESYAAASGLEVLHIDLYRIDSTEELRLIGLDEYPKQDYAWLIEWPGNGADVVPVADVRVRMQHADKARKISLEFIGERWEVE